MTRTFLPASIAAVLASITPAQAEAPSPESSNILVVAAHQDDDVLVSVPDLAEAIAEDRTIQTLYLTSGDAGFPCTSYTRSRELGAKAVHAQLAGVPNQWIDQERVVNGKVLRVSTLVGTHQSLAFVGLPDGKLEGLWNSATAKLSTLTWDGRSRVDSYTREQLIETVRALMVADGVDDVRLLDASRLQPPMYPFEHPDHVTSALVGLAATQRYAQADQVTMYRTYNIQFEPVNMSEQDSGLRRSLFDLYKPYDVKICGGLFTRICGRLTTCDSPALYEGFIARHYPIEMQHSEDALLQVTSGKCLASANNTVQVQSCNAAVDWQHWSLSGGGELRNLASGLCLRGTGTGNASSFALEPCARTAAQQFYVTDQGQLRGTEATCVRFNAGALTLVSCTDEAAQLGFKLLPPGL